ncbi:hypothetical protein TeGR_g4819, partial [Tetraparma gracilis]
MQVQGDASRSWTYDAVFGTSSTTDEVYSAVTEGIIDKLFSGYNATILAYGQTGSGKTFTMGTNFDSPSGSPSGVIPCVVADVFSRAAQAPGEAEVSLSYLEVYNEEVKDLLIPQNPSAPPAAPLQVRENVQGDVVIPNLTFKSVTSAAAVSKIMSAASSARATGSTAMNAGSSRSHAICTLYLTVTPPADAEDDTVVTSKFTLVDLAGSERQKRTGADGDRLKEGISINKGLFVLGQVVSGLAEKSSLDDPSSSTSHIPYRDSKLTRLLTSSLGGNSLTVMVACVSPADINLEESANTLRYAQRARAIKNEAVKNVVASAISGAE